MIIIAGPTGVGKTELSLKLAAQLKSPAIINADLGQFYTPLTIGTAKPDWCHEPMPHYLFDILDQPENFTAFQYRRLVIELLEKLNSVIANNRSNTTPILVGGSGFYLQALFFKSPLDKLYPEASDNSPAFYDNNSPESSPEKILALENLKLWEKLNQIDPVRARELNSHDHYRIQRALEIWQKYKILPSQAKPEYAPIVPQTQKIKLLILTRDLPELYARIDQRVLEMLDAGWATEVQNLVDTPWEKFLLAKRLIGYDDLLKFFRAAKSNCVVSSRYLNSEKIAASTVQLIQKRSRNYAKRQIAFFKMLTRQLTEKSAGQIEIEWLNLTATDVDLYIKRLLSDPNFAKIASLKSE
ncbi:MAG TPA: tRNA (adenosine(37)-N6)-dimethylallyltransferase MiaA [Candidatus Babeliales bacterium]|nr:tRNA (adenosine(37)-N6)-dimethylallyltransferase MiaA [Candidatus Babeliales bacterium]